jgi:hypothetical protein
MPFELQVESKQIESTHIIDLYLISATYKTNQSKIMILFFLLFLCINQVKEFN